MTSTEKHAVVVRAEADYGGSVELTLYCAAQGCEWGQSTENEIYYGALTAIADEHEALNIPRGEVIE